MVDQRQALLDFWFGGDDDEAGRKVWFTVDPAFDAELRQRFGALSAQALAGALDGWAETAEGALALVLLLDQLPRNLNRGQHGAFACDEKARQIARLAVARGFDRALAPVRRQFFYLPFEHSEDLADQAEGVRLFASLPEGTFRDNCVAYARRHHAVIERFGRFPHRNAALGRATTEEEQEFLQGPGAPF